MPQPRNRWHAVSLNCNLLRDVFQRDEFSYLGQQLLTVRRFIEVTGRWTQVATALNEMFEFVRDPSQDDHGDSGCLRIFL